MKKLYLSLLFICGLFMAVVNAQTRYLDEVFTDAEIEVTTNQPYGQNTTVLAFPTLIKQPLVMDVYRPASDTETNRPVVLYLHTGNFLPFHNPANGDPFFNGSCGGTIRDSAVIESCMRLAKMGYVAAAVDYRLGWNPLAASDVDRRYGIINAAYRGIQDTRTCIRYFKKTIKEAGNPWGVDSTKIVLFGQGTGGYLSMNSIFLDNYLKIPLATGGKFIWDHDQDPMTPPIPMIIEPVNGDIWGTSVGQNPATGDTLCHINHAGYTSDFQLAVNLGGACADTSWIDPGQPPLISFHVPYDFNADYDEGIVNVPGTNLQVVEIQGSYNIQMLMDAYGNNNSFSSQIIPDLAGNQADAYAQTPMVNGEDWSTPTPGLYPFVGPIEDVGGGIMIASNNAPWEWSAAVGPGGNCNTDRAFAMNYLDTIFRFYAPRACFALGLQDCVDQVLSNKEPIATHIDVLAAPNPATDLVRFSSEEQILAIQVFDRTSRLVRTVSTVNNNTYTLQRNGLEAGLYVVKLSFKDGFVTKMVSFN